MIEPQTISEAEHGLVRVFMVSRQSDMKRGDRLSPEQIADSLGVDQLDMADVQQAWTHELDGMTISDFLRAGYEVNEDDLAQHQEAFDAIGEVSAILVFIRSGAFTARPATLNLTGLLNHVATLREPDAQISFDPLPNPDPEAVLEDAPQKKPPSDAAMSGRIATIALLVMALLVWLMIRIGG